MYGTLELVPVGFPAASIVDDAAVGVTLVDGAAAERDGVGLAVATGDFVVVGVGDAAGGVKIGTPLSFLVCGSKRKADVTPACVLPYVWP